MATLSIARLSKFGRAKEFLSISECTSRLTFPLSSMVVKAARLSSELVKRIEGFEMKCLFGISWHERKTHEYVRATIKQKVGTQEELLSIIKMMKMAWFGHVTCHQTMSKTIFLGTVPGARKRGRQRKQWMDNIRHWTGQRVNELIRIVIDRRAWRLLSHQSS